MKHKNSVFGNFTKRYFVLDIESALISYSIEKGGKTIGSIKIRVSPFVTL